MSDDQSLEASFDLIRHFSPSEVEDIMYDVINLNPNHADEILSTTDIPFQIETDPKTKRKYIKCDYNRDGDSYRSPFSNEYYPPLEGGFQISQKLRDIETLAQSTFQVYLEQYFRTGTISIYCWPPNEDEISNSQEKFNVGVFIKKDLNNTLLNDKSMLNDGKGTRVDGSINCSDVFEVTQISGNTYQYDLISSVLLFLDIDTNLGVPLRIAGNSSHQSQRTVRLNESSPKEHLIQVGQMVEDNQTKYMGRIKEIYVSKMKQAFTLLK